MAVHADHARPRDHRELRAGRARHVRRRAGRVRAGRRRLRAGRPPVHAGADRRRAAARRTSAAERCRRSRARCRAPTRSRPAAASRRAAGSAGEREICRSERPAFDLGDPAAASPATSRDESRATAGVMHRQEVVARRAVDRRRRCSSGRRPRQGLPRARASRLAQALAARRRRCLLRDQERRVARPRRRVGVGEVDRRAAAARAHRRGPAAAVIVRGAAARGQRAAASRRSSAAACRWSSRIRATRSTR